VTQLSKLTVHQIHKLLYCGKPTYLLLGHFFRLQKILLKDIWNREAVQEIAFLQKELLKNIEKTRGVKEINYVTGYLRGLKRDQCDTSTVANLLQRLELIRNHRLAGKPNPHHLTGGAAGNGTGKSGR